MTIELGDKVKCIYSGFEGVAIARTEFINGCVQFSVLPKSKDGKIPEEIGIDEDSLKVVGTTKKQVKKDTGGPMKQVSKCRW